MSRQAGVRNGTSARVNFPPMVGAALVDKAEREGRTISDIIRQAVGELVLTRQVEQSPQSQVQLS